MKIKLIKIVNYVIFIIIIIFLLLSSYLLGDKYLLKYKTIKEIKSNEEIAFSEAFDIKKIQEQYNNNDIKAVLEINSLNIKTPIVKTNNNSYYLNHNIYKKESIVGTLFIDKDNDLNGKQINIYGHNSGDYDIPFKKLQSYLKKDFYDNNKEIIFKYDNVIEYYEIFSVAIVNKTIKEEHMTFIFNSLDEWENHFNILKDKSIYKSNLVVNKYDKIIVLQTCLFGRYEGKLLLVIAKKIMV